jgi:hypothetical protein
MPRWSNTFDKVVNQSLMRWGVTFPESSPQAVIVRAGYFLASSFLPALR